MAKFKINPFRRGGFINKDYDMARVYVDLPIIEAKKLVNNLNSDFSKIKADAIREMMDFCANQERYCGLDQFSVSEIREYINLLEEGDEQ